MEAVFGIVAIGLGLVIVWQLFALIGDMAEDRGQPRLPWQLVGLFWSPFGSIIVLWLFFDLVEDQHRRGGK